MRVSCVSIQKSLESRGYKADKETVELITSLLDDYIMEDYNTIRDAIDKAIDSALPY